MTSRTKRLGLGGVILGGAVAVSSFLFSGCKLDKNYWSSPRAVDDMAILSVVPAGLLPYAKTIPQAAALNIASQGLQTEAIRMSVDRMNNGQGDRGENQQNYDPNKPIEVNILTYVGGHDRNGNGVLETVNNEFVGLGDKFWEILPPTINFRIDRCIPDVTLWISSVNGEWRDCRNFGNTDRGSYNFGKTLPPGDYRITLGSNDEWIGGKEIKLYDKNVLGTRSIEDFPVPRMTATFRNR